MEFRKNIGEGVNIIYVKRDDPIDRLRTIGRQMRTKERLQKIEVPVGDNSRKRVKKLGEKIKKDANRYFNSRNK